MNEQERKAEMARMLNAHPDLAPDGVREIGYMVADFLKGSVADADTAVDTGCGFGEFDCAVKVRGEEYWVVVKKSGYTWAPPAGPVGIEIPGSSDDKNAPNARRAGQ